MTTMTSPDGRLTAPIRYMQRHLRISVRMKHIQRATPGDAQNCALALAARDMPGVEWARFERSVAYIGYADRVERYDLGSAARRAIIGFDATRGMGSNPGTVILNPVKASNMPAVKAAINKRIRQFGAVNPQGPTPQRNSTVAALLSLGVRDGTGKTQTSATPRRGAATP